MLCRLGSITFAVFLLSDPGWAFAQGGATECEQVLSATQRSGRTVWYDVEGALFQTAEVSPRPDNDEVGTYGERVYFQSGEGSRRQSLGIDIWSCADNMLHLNQRTFARGSDNGEFFDPPLPVFDLSANAGDQWTWVGTWTAEMLGGRADYPAGAEFTVLQEETIVTDAGRFMTTPVQMDVRIGSVVEVDHRVVLWVTITPAFTIVQRQMTTADSDDDVEETWTIRRLAFGEDDEESGEDPATTAAANPCDDGPVEFDEGEVGTLGVSSSPRGVVYIDGVNTGELTPRRRFEVQAGCREVRVYFEDEDVFSEVKTVLISPGVNSNVFFRHQRGEEPADDVGEPPDDVDEPETGMLFVSSPRWGSVFIDGVDSGFQTFEEDIPVSAGCHRVQVIHRDDETQSEEQLVWIFEDRNMTLWFFDEEETEGTEDSDMTSPCEYVERVGIERIGLLGVASSPTGRVYVDGIDMGQNTPARGIPLEAGRHEVNVFFNDEGVFDEVERVLIRGGVSTNVIFLYRAVDEADLTSEDADPTGDGRRFSVLPAIGAVDDASVLEQACPVGFAAIGLSAHVSDRIEAIQWVCGSVTDPAAWPVHLDWAGTESEGTTMFTSTCPVGEVVIGLRGYVAYVVV